MEIPAALRSRLAPVRRDAGRLLSGLPLHLAPVVAWLFLVGLILRAPLAAPVPVAVVLVLTPALTAVQRYRHWQLFDTDLPRLPVVDGPWPIRLVRWLRAPEVWRQVAYHAVIGPLIGVAEAVALAVWVVGIVTFTVYVWIFALPPEWRISEIGYGTQAAYVTAAGLLLVCVSPWLARLVARLEVGAAGTLLGPIRSKELQRRVDDLTESRAGVVDAADAERRRIERDLHDGAQQRLVSLAVNLGLAKATLTDVPEDARRVIHDAHREAKEAITELSNLVRGFHPAVLEDRGLDAALSGLAARAPVPVSIEVSLASRPSPTVEAVAYFLVSEALTNATKHANATHIEVAVVRSGTMLR